MPGLRTNSTIYKIFFHVHWIFYITRIGQIQSKGRLSTTTSNGSMSLVTMLSTQWKYLNFSVWTNHALVVTNNGLATIHQYNGYGYTGLCTGYQMNQNQPLYWFYISTHCTNKHICNNVDVSLIIGCQVPSR